MNRETETQKSLNRYSTILLAFVIFINLMAVAGWLLHKPILASLRREYIPMAPATALVFLVFCGVWLIQKRFFYRSTVRILVRLILVGIVSIGPPPCNTILHRVRSRSRTIAFPKSAPVWTNIIRSNVTPDCIRIPFGNTCIFNAYQS